MTTNLVKPNVGFKILSEIFIFCLLLVYVSASAQISANKDYQSGIEKFEFCQFDSAIVYYSKAEQKSIEAKNLNGAISAQIRLAEVYCEIAQYETMWKLIEEIKRQIKNEDPSMDNLHFNFSTLLTGIYVTFAQPDSAKYYMNDAAILLGKINDPYLKAYYYYQSAQYYKFIYDANKAYENTDSAIACYPMISPLFKAKCYALKQKVAYQRKDYDLMKRLCDHITLTLDELKIGEHPLRAKVFEGIAFIALDKQDCSTANNGFEKSCHLLQKYYPENSPEIASAFNQLGISNGSLRNDSIELIYHLKSYKIRIKLFGPENYNTTFSYTNFGNYYSMKVKNIDTALYFYEKAVNIRSKVLGLKHQKLANSYLKLANMYSVNNNYNKAIKYANMVICAAHPTYSDTANVFNNPVIGNYYSSEVYNAMRLKSAEICNRFLTNNPSVEIFYLKKYIDCVKKMDTLQNNAYYNRSVINESALFNIAEAYFPFSYYLFQLYKLTQDSAYLNEIVEYADKSKSSIFHNDLNQFSFENSKYAKSLKNYRYESFLLQKKLVLEKLDEGQKLKIKQLNLHYEDSIATVEYKLKDKTNRQNSISNAKVNLKALQAKMSDNEAIISYTTRTLSAFGYLVVTKDSINFFYSGNDVSAIFETFILLNQQKQEYCSDLYNEVSNKLYNCLFPDDVKGFLNRSKIESLILIPDQKLWLLPFEALLTEKVNQETSDFASLPYLIKKYRISYAPSFYFAYQSLLRSNQVKYNKDLLMVAPVFDNKTSASLSDETRGFIQNLNTKVADSTNAENDLVSRGTISPLPYTEAESKNIEKLFYSRNYKPEIMLRENASFLNLVSNPLNYRIIHFASHAYANYANPDLSGILLSSEKSESENILFGGQIKNMQINADLVVLSACETGLGKVITGEGITNLSRSFALSKVPNVVSSLWKVADQSTAELMIDFYKDLLKHRFSSYSESLHRAKLKMIQEGKYAQPFYWAPFVLTRY